MQPKGVRNNYALGLAGTFTGIVALIWVVTKAGSVPLPVDAVENAPSAFSTLIKETKEQAAAAQNALRDSMKANNESVATSTTDTAPTPAEVAPVAEATTTSSTTASSTVVTPVPVMIGTTTATSAPVTATSTP